MIKKKFRKLLTTALVATLVLSSANFTGINFSFADEISKPSIDVIWNDEDGTAEVITGAITDKPVFDGDSAADFLTGNKDMLSKNSRRSLTADNSHYIPDSVTTDEYGNSHYRTNLVVDEIPVYGAEMIVHTNADGDVYAVNGKTKAYVPNKAWSDEFTLTEQDAIDYALADLNVVADEAEFVGEPKVEKFIYDFNGQFNAVYVVDVNYLMPEVGGWVLFIDGATGKVVDKYSTVEAAYNNVTGTGLDVDGNNHNINISESNGSYFLIDGTRTSSVKVYDMKNSSNEYATGTLMIDTDTNFNAENQKAGVSALINGGIVFDYYKNIHNRNSIDDKGMDIIMAVHFDRNYDNAFWFNGRMVFGDGSGGTTGFKPLSCSLDVIAHEMTHGVTENTSNLEYRNQSGAMNEAMSDILGIACESYIEGPNSDWLLGEDLYTTAGKALRSMSDPASLGYPDHMNDYYNTTSDNGGVHTNSSIINKAAYNIGSVIGKEDMGKLFYKADRDYLTSTSDFNAMRSCALLAAADMYGKDTTNYNVVMDGFAAVGIGSASGGGTDPNPGETAGWIYETKVIESQHNYRNNTVDTKIITNSNASQVTAYFDNISLENNYDFIYIKDANDNIIQTLTGSIGSKQVTVDGNTMKVQLVTDYSVRDYGYKISKVGFYFNDTNDYTPEGVAASVEKNQKSLLDSKDKEKVKAKKEAKGQEKKNNDDTTFEDVIDVIDEAISDVLDEVFTDNAEFDVTWIKEDVSYESNHEYDNNVNEWTNIAVEGATALNIHFDVIDLEEDVDFLIIYDQNGDVVDLLTGYIEDYSVVVEGGSADMNFITNSENTGYGYHIDSVSHIAE